MRGGDIYDVDNCIDYRIDSRSNYFCSKVSLVKFSYR